MDNDFKQVLQDKESELEQIKLEFDILNKESEENDKIAK